MLFVLGIMKGLAVDRQHDSPNSRLCDW